MTSLPRVTASSPRRWLALLAIPTLPLALLACSGESDGGGGLSSSSSGMGGDGGSGAGGGTTSSTTSSGTTSSSGTGGDMTGGYPPPPYGHEVDDTFPFLAWEGWINPGADQLATGGTYGPFDSEGIRTAGESFALVHLAADF